jgi:RND family efflux transporter MFP subunit
MKLKNVFSILISLLLIALIVVVLVRNKQEIDRKAQLSLEVNTVIPVSVIQPQWAEINSSITATGKIMSCNIVILTSKTQGTVLEKYRQNGDRITKGAPIAKVEDHLIRESLGVAESNCAKAKKDAERYENLHKAGVVTKSELEAVLLALKNAEQQVFDLNDRLQNTLIAATAPGVLENLVIEAGSLVAPGMTVAEIIDPVRLKMEIYVTEQEVVLLKRGQAVSITSDVFAGKVFEGSINTIGAKGDNSLSYKVEISMPASDNLKPGMFAVARIYHETKADKKKQLVIDRRCIVGGMKNPKIYVISENKASMRTIVAGRIVENQVEILHGLSENETVVLDGQINLTEGSSVKIINL